MSETGFHNDNAMSKSNHADRSTMVKDESFKHKNKNEGIKLKVTVDDKEENDDKIDILKILREDNDASSALMDIEVVLSCFNKCPVLFHFGDIYIHLNHDIIVYNDMMANSYTKTIPLQGLNDICNSIRTFVILGLVGDKVCVLPKNAMTYSLIDKLGIQQKSMHAKITIKLKDIMPIYFKEKRKQRKNISGKLILPRNKTETFHINQVISVRKKRHLCKCTSGRIRKHVICPRLNRRFRIFRHYPVEDELLKYPIQVENDDFESQQEEQVPSAVTPLLHVTDNLSSFTSALNFTNNAQISASTSGRPNIQPRYREYLMYRERLASFERWSHERPTPTQLSDAGFFSTNEGDLVRCFQCGIGLKDFSEDDDPLLEHVRHSRKCPFLPQHLGEKRLASIKRHLRQTDPEYNRQIQLNGELHQDELVGYRHPEYRTLEARISSFTNWPRHMIQTPQRLAEAGLYYIGVEDHVRCFACDGGLKRWDPEDDPWTEHCRWFPACPFAIEQKGQQFIALIQASFENERAEASGGGVEHGDLVRDMERLRIRESETEKVIKIHGPICRDMGFEVTDLKEAVLELHDRGNTKPSIEDIVDVIEVIIDRKQTNNSINVEETPIEENRRLKKHVFCMKCGKNNICALFLPCTHHRLCMSCAETLQTCPICRRHIKEKIRTYMV